MKNIKSIWTLLSIKQKKTFSLLLFFGLFVLLLEIISIGSIFPVVYSINDSNFYEGFEFLEKFEQFFSNNKYNFSVFILLILFFVILIKNSLMTYFFWLESKFIIETQENLSKKLYSNLLNQDFRYHQNNNSAELITRIRTDSLLIREAISSLFKLFQSTIFISGILVFLVSVEPMGFAITTSVFLLMGTSFNFLTSKKALKLEKSGKNKRL